MIQRRFVGVGVRAARPLAAGHFGRRQPVGQALGLAMADYFILHCYFNSIITPQGQQPPQLAQRSRYWSSPAEAID